MINDYQGPASNIDMLKTFAPGEIVKGALLTDDGCPILVFESGDGIKFGLQDGLDKRKPAGVSFEKMTAPMIASLIDGRKKKIAELTKEIERLGTMVRANAGHQDADR